MLAVLLGFSVISPYFAQFTESIRRMASTKEALMTEVVASQPTSQSKISVVGVGQVGMAAAFSIMQQVSPQSIYSYIRKIVIKLIEDSGRSF